MLHARVAALSRATERDGERQEARREREKESTRVQERERETSPLLEEGEEKREGQENERTGHGAVPPRGAKGA